MENQDDPGTFRDRLSTISEEGNRVWVYPKRPKGKYYNSRGLLSVILLLFFFMGPLITIKGDPMLLFNIL
jgi:hypothetical protein